MLKGGFRFIFVAGVLGAAAASQASFTVATFDDPASNGSTPLFRVTTSELSGGWSGDNLTLKLMNGLGGLDTYDDVTFTLTDADNGATLHRSGTSIDEGGIIRFLDATNTELFKITFGSASIYSLGWGGSNEEGLDEEFVANDVKFYLKGKALDLSQEMFSFSFANRAAGTGYKTYTAAMTSSAEAVPEPFTMALLAGGLGLAAIRRRRAR